MNHVKACDAIEFVSSLEDNSIDLFLTDPPYFHILEKNWDKQWSSVDEYVEWFIKFVDVAYPKMKDDASFIFFGGIGKHNSHPLWRLVDKIEQRTPLYFRNSITWSKRRAYGKSHDYLFCREEIMWYSKSCERTSVKFNVPYTSEVRGYAGYNKKYAAKSEYKRVTNVWNDITELFRTEREAQKPIKLLERLVKTHSNKGDTVCDPFTGWGSTGIASLFNERKFIGCEIDSIDALLADKRCQRALDLLADKKKETKESDYRELQRVLYEANQGIESIVGHDCTEQRDDAIIESEITT